MATNNQIGRLGEDIAAKYFTDRGYRISARNYRTSFGEIDLILNHGNEYLFVEVKTRVGLRMGQPYEAVDLFKYNRIKKSAQLYVLQKNLQRYKLSVHVVSVVLKENLQLSGIRHYENVQL